MTEHKLTVDLAEALALAEAARAMLKALKAVRKKFVGHLGAEECVMLPDEPYVHVIDAAIAQAKAAGITDD